MTYFDPLRENVLHVRRDAREAQDASKALRSHLGAVRQLTRWGFRLADSRPAITLAHRRLGRTSRPRLLKRVMLLGLRARFSRRSRCIRNRSGLRYYELLYSRFPRSL